MPGNCAFGYLYKEGDIVGWGFGGSREESQEQCAERCENTNGCNSYQYSVSAAGNNCAIHTGGETEIHGRTYRDFFMCFKTGIGFLLLIITQAIWK